VASTPDSRSSEVRPPLLPSSLARRALLLLSTLHLSHLEPTDPRSSQNLPPWQNQNTDELTMPPTITADKDNAEPSAPPLTDSIPVVAAYAISNDEPATSASLPPRPPPNVAVPQGMVAKTVTSKYADGREVTVTEYHPADTSNGVTPAPAATTSTATAAPSNYVPPRRDLGSVPVTFTCPFCSHAGPTRTRADCGDCTWISVIILLLCCFPFFWVPFVCNNVSNV
jgi:hypothetical protein